MNTAAKQRHFKPHPLVKGGHLQTLMAHFGKGPKGVADDLTAEIPVSGGDRLVATINPDNPEVTASSRSAPSKRPAVLLIFHGLSGCSRSLYAQHLAYKLPRRGIIVVRVNHRGCGLSEPTSRGIYHAGSSGDLADTISWAAERWPTHRLYAAGFSLSGNMLLNYAARSEFQPRHPGNLAAVMAISSPINLELCSLAIARLSNIHFDQYFTRRLIASAKRRRQWPRFPPALQDKRRPWLTLRDFDEILTARLAGYRDRDDYYDRASAFPHLGQITCHTTVLAAADDPFIPPESYTNAQWSPSTRFTLLPAGGHVGFIARHPTMYGDHRWLDEYITHWIETETNG